MTYTLDPNATVHGITGIDDDLVVFCKAGFDYGFHSVAAAELYGMFLGAAVADKDLRVPKILPRTERY